MKQHLLPHPLTFIALVLGWVLVFFTSTEAWAQKTGELKVDLEVLSSTTNAPVLPEPGETFYVGVAIHTGKAPRTRLPLNVAFVVDVSAQTNSTTLRHIVDALNQVTQALRPGDIVSVVSFDATVEVLLPPSTWPEQAAFEQAVQRLNPGQGAALFAGVVKGAGEVRRNLSRDRANRVVVLSSSTPNTGPTQISAYEQLGLSLQREGIGVTTIGLESKFNEDLLLSLARQSGGQYHVVSDLQTLPRLFTRGIKALGQLIAPSGSISLKFVEGLRPVEVSTPWSDLLTNSATLNLRPMYDLDREELMVLVQRETNRPLEGLLLEAEVSYYDPYTQKSRRSFSELNSSSLEIDRASTILTQLIHVLNQLRRHVADHTPEQIPVVRAAYQGVLSSFLSISQLDHRQVLSDVSDSIKEEQKLLGGPYFRKYALRNAHTPSTLLSRTPF